jgi:hypothetical protein
VDKKIIEIIMKKKSSFYQICILIFLLALFKLSPAYSQCLNTTTWNGVSWSLGVPNSTKSALILGDYDTLDYGSIDCCDLTVGANTLLTISNGDYCNVYGNIAVDPLGSILVKSGASLIPLSLTSTSSGPVSVERRTTPLKRYDYTYWSSPVATIIGNALPPIKWEPTMTFAFNTNNFYDVETTYFGSFISNNPDGQDDDNNAWENTAPSDPMIKGKGYASMVKSLISTGTYPRVESVIFTGELNTGNISIPLKLSQNTSNDMDDFNLVGNPYSSAINSDDVIDFNLPNISGTLYFWTHSNTMTTSYSGLAMYNFSTNDYAKYTRLGGITAVFGGKRPSNVIGSCQGFLVEAENTNSLIFHPNMMSKAYVNSTAVSFFRENNRKFRLLLNMQNGDGLFSQQLIGYEANTDKGYNKGWDSRIPTPTQILKFYSIGRGVKYDIQSRGIFNNMDIVKLGYFSAIDSKYKISMDAESVTLNQKIYLVDRLTGYVHDLSLPYEFETLAGTYNDRFSIRYTNRFSISNQINPVPINSNRFEAYDLSGRLIGVADEEEKLFAILPKRQILIIKKYENEEIVTTKYYGE